MLSQSSRLPHPGSRFEADGHKKRRVDASSGSDSLHTLPVGQKSKLLLEGKRMPGQEEVQKAESEGGRLISIPRRIQASEITLK